MKTAKHCRDCGAAVNVKQYGSGLVDGGTDEQRSMAWELTQASWWRQANEAARECGYSGVAACGRSGGWCAPFNVARYAPGGQVYEDDEAAPRFVAFAEKIDALMQAVPRMFAESLAQAMADDESNEREAARITAERARDAAVLAMVPRLAVTLRHALDTIDACGSINMDEARALLAEYEAVAALQESDARKLARLDERRKLEAQFCAPFRDDDMRDAFNGSIGIGEAFNALRGARPVSLLRIDAWRDGDGWTWNAWHKLASVPMSWADLKPRALLRELRAHGYIEGAGRLAIEDDGFNIVVMAKGTREPLLAVAYGEAP